MSAILMFLAATAAVGPPAAEPPVAAPTEAQSAAKAREFATNQALLEALLQKRAEIARSPLPVNDPRHVEGRRYALEFLDGQIAKIRKEMDQ